MRTVPSINMDALLDDEMEKKMESSLRADEGPMCIRDTMNARTNMMKLITRATRQFPPMLLYWMIIITAITGALALMISWLMRIDIQYRYTYGPLNLLSKEDLSGSSFMGGSLPPGSRISYKLDFGFPLIVASWGTSLMISVIIVFRQLHNTPYAFNIFLLLISTKPILMTHDNDAVYLHSTTITEENPLFIILCLSVGLALTLSLGRQLSAMHKLSLVLYSGIILSITRFFLIDDLNLLIYLGEVNHVTTINKEKANLYMMTLTIILVSTILIKLILHLLDDKSLLYGLSYMDHDDAATNKNIRIMVTSCAIKWLLRTRKYGGVNVSIALIKDELRKVTSPEMMAQNVWGD